MRGPTILFHAVDIQGWVAREHGRDRFDKDAHVVARVHSFDAHRFADALVEAAMTEREYIDLAGLSEDETSDPYETVAHALRKALERVEALRAHAHEWTEDAYCAICGADGRV